MCVLCIVATWIAISPEAVHVTVYTKDAIETHIYLVSFVWCDWFADKKDQTVTEEWSVDPQIISKLKEQYKRERQRDGKSGGSVQTADSML